MKQTPIFFLTAALLLAAPSARTDNRPSRWQKMPMLSPQAKKAGIFPGGEGGQWPRWTVAISETDPNFMLLPIDVGGLYRTWNGGKYWELTMTGWRARGANMFAIDPRNANRALGVGANSRDWDPDWGPSPHGVYLTRDKARTWKQVVPTNDGLCGSVAFDPTSFDRAGGYCTRAYYASPSKGLFRSTDGGERWQNIYPAAAEMDNDNWNPALIAVQGRTGWVYLGGQKGLYRSKNHGATWEPVYSGGAVWGRCLVKTAPERVWISGTEGVLVSRDDGKTFTRLPEEGINRDPGNPIRNIAVSPANPQRMLCWITGQPWTRYRSEDGGQHWHPIAVESGTAERIRIDAKDSWNQAGPNEVPGGWAFLPCNPRNGVFTWHPTNSNLVYGLGGDWVTRSTDGGKRFSWHNNGFNGVMVGGKFNFSRSSPGTVFLAFQDYNAAFTTDGGKTWNYRDASGRGWGGHCYGGYAVDKQVMWYGDAENWGGQRKTRISHDGGRTWQFAVDTQGKECSWQGDDVSFADPLRPNILFASNWRSTDKGKTWHIMSDCDGVYTTSPDGKTLFGRGGENIMRSTDGGTTWEAVVMVPGGFRDLAYDAVRQRFYVASEGKLKQYDRNGWKALTTPRDDTGGSGPIDTVATDPQNPAIVYAGGAANVRATAVAVIRSTDAGQTWINLTTGSGPHEVQAIRVHLQTREAWVAGQCFGMWRIAAPR